MAGWNGAGTYDLRYTFVNDASANIKILASRQDQMWNDLKAGIQNCMTLDGQTTPTQNINLGGMKITNLAAATLASDAVRFDQVTTSEWTAESHGLTWVSATSFKILAVDVTSIYTSGRRIKFLDNGNQRYGTVVSSSFSTDTTLIVAVDGGTALVGPTTAVSYGLIAAASGSSPVWTDVSFFSSTTAFSGTGVYTSATISSEANDVLNEITTGAAGTFIPKVTGLYMFIGWLGVNSDAGTTGISGSTIVSNFFVGGVGSTGLGFSLAWPFANSLARTLSVPLHSTISLTAGDIVTFRAQAIYTGNAPTFAIQGSMRRLA